MKRVLISGGILLVAISLGLGFWLWTPAPDSFDRARAIEIASAYDARIIRDQFGVPHIYGQRDADVAFGLAYAHAEDDIQTIQSTRSFTRGEMALETGEEGAVTDYLVAALQAREATAEKYEKDLSAAMRAVLDGYVAGINFYCAEQETRCAPGFAPLTPQDIVASYVARTPFFYGFEGQLKALFDGDVDLEQAPEQARSNYLGTDSRVATGSNAIAVAPTRSSDGHTRLFVNSHQPFVGPVAWYEARLKSEEGWDMIGGLFPGSPVVSHGANPDLGWAITVNQPDLVDIYKLTVNDPDAPTQYLLDGTWRDFDISTVDIRVKLFGPFSFPSTQTLRHSVHGPVFKTSNGFFAVSFAGYQNVQAIEQFFRMNKARSEDEWLAAMAIQGIPSFNFVYADKLGNINYIYNAQVPERSAEWDWSKVAPGDRSDLLWRGIRPFNTATPNVFNPTSGYLVNANHTPFESTAAADKPKRSDFPPHYGISDKTTNRGLRAQALYGGDVQITEEEFLAYKMDNTYAADSRLLIFLSELAEHPDIKDSEEFSEALSLFAAWDGATELDRRGAGLAIRTGQIAKGMQINGNDAEETDPVLALRQAIAEFKNGFGRIDPTWGEVNRLKRGDVDLALRGGPDVLRAIYSVDNPKHGSLTAIAGDSYILYADWAPDGTQEVRTIHQFGSATLDRNSRHYADQTELFANEQYKTPPMTLDAVLREATADYRPGGR